MACSGKVEGVVRDQSRVSTNGILGRGVALGKLEFGVPFVRQWTCSPFQNRICGASGHVPMEEEP